MRRFHPVPSQMPNPVSLISDRLRAWELESQQGARRNAMIASTALAARRAERQEVDDFFATRAPRPTLPAAVHR